jgi:sulfur relay (sulfurtransferase) DsrF/TusC family protein
MTNNEKITSERLSVSIEKCKIHMKRLNYALSKAGHLFPLTEEGCAVINDEMTGYIDQMIFRYTKLQDELGNNTFRLLLEYLREDIANKPFRDILNILERLQIIDSSDVWIYQRELRKDLAHEYPMMVAETVLKLNQLYKQLPVMENILSTVISKVKGAARDD